MSISRGDSLLAEGRARTQVARIRGVGGDGIVDRDHSANMTVFPSTRIKRGIPPAFYPLCVFGKRLVAKVVRRGALSE